MADPQSIYINLKTEYIAFQNKHAKIAIQRLIDLTKQFVHKQCLHLLKFFSVSQIVTLIRELTKKNLPRNVIAFSSSKIASFSRKCTLKSKDLFANFNYCRLYQLHFTKFLFFYLVFAFNLFVVIPCSQDTTVRCVTIRIRSK